VSNHHILLVHKAIHLLVCVSPLEERNLDKSEKVTKTHLLEHFSLRMSGERLHTWLVVKLSRSRMVAAAVALRGFTTSPNKW
jgi:hypothetical protein